MSADPGFQVQAEAITRHATTVDGVADQVAEGRAAASAVNLGRDAYGILCSLIPALLEPVQESVIEALRGSADALQSAADDLRATARDYTGSDKRTADQFRGGGAG
jgi:methyl-accepting chemotaxis protein